MKVSRSWMSGALKIAIAGVANTSLLKLKLFRFYSNLLKMAIEVNFTWDEALAGTTHPSLNWERKIYHREFIFTFSKQRRLRKFHVTVKITQTAACPITRHARNSWYKNLLQWFQHITIGIYLQFAAKLTALVFSVQYSLQCICLQFVHEFILSYT